MNFITDTAEFEEEKIRLGRLINPTAALPQFVFDPALRSVRFFEFDLIFSDNGWTFLQLLAKSHGDNSICLWMLDPDPDTYFHKHFAKFGAARFLPESSPEKYLDQAYLDPGGSPADSLAFVAESVAIYGSSSSWAIWGNRSREVAIVAEHGQEVSVNGDAVETRLRLSNAWDAVTRIAEQTFRPGQLPPDFIRAFLESYSCKP